MRFVILYLVAIILSNLTVTLFGPTVAVLNAFLFIGLDLTARDNLHEAWQGKGLFWKMTLLIVAGSVLSYLLNHASGQIAFASFVAFSATGLVDSIIFHLLRKKPRLIRVNGSNIPSAVVDSLLFTILAFNLPIMWNIVLGQMAAKILGGFCWSFILKDKK